MLDTALLDATLLDEALLDIALLALLELELNIFELLASLGITVLLVLLALLFILLDSFLTLTPQAVALKIINDVNVMPAILLISF